MSEIAQTFDALEQEATVIARQIDIPPCPTILLRFNEEYNSPRPDLRRLAELVSTDIGLSATLVKTVNAPFYGLAHKASSVQQALAILGLKACASLVSGLMLVRAFPSESGAALERFWAGSMRLAGLATAIAARLRGIDREEAHTYVLFRDCGMLVMLRKHPEYAGVMDLTAQVPGMQLTRVEDARFKFNHARVASALARSWGLSEPLCDAISLHHNYSEAAVRAAAGDAAVARFVAFGLLAEQIVALTLNQGLCPDWVDAEAFVLSTLGIDAESVVELAEELRSLTV